MKRFTAVLLSVALASSIAVADSDSENKKHNKDGRKPDAYAELLKELREMKQSIAAQQQEIEQLRNAVAQRDQQLSAGQNATQQAQAAAQQAQTKAAEASATTEGLKSEVTDLKASNATVTQALQGTEKRIGSLENPLTIHYKGINITPGGFLAAETVWRQHGTASDINTPFNSIPFKGAGAYPQSEFYGSGRQSRISILAEGKTTFAKLGGYYEMDWLSSGTTSNNNQSNSYTNRMRQLYAQVVLNSGWTVTGGQMWSLVTETKKGVDNRSEATPMAIDAQYTVGFSWARQYGFRVSKKVGYKTWLAASIENPQTTFAGHNQAANFNFGNAGTSGGLYNAYNGTYSFNKSPDFVFKAAFEPGLGHYEIFGIVSPFRDRIYPNATASPASAAGAYNSTRVGGGIGANARVSLVQKHLDVGLHFLGGDGVGRYGTSSLPDTTVRPDGTLTLLHAYQGLGTIEWHAKSFDVYMNGGFEDVGRHSQLNSAGKAVGYGDPSYADYGCTTETVPTGTTGYAPGTPANCTGDTHDLIEGTFGFWLKPYNGPKGRIQFGPQYSYIVRNAWTGLGATAGTSVQPHTIENIVLTSFRYYLP